MGGLHKSAVKFVGTLQGDEGGMDKPFVQVCLVRRHRSQPELDTYMWLDYHMHAGMPDYIISRWVHPASVSHGLLKFMLM